jgi:hypothetical protein
VPEGGVLGLQRSTSGFELILAAGYRLAAIDFARQIENAGIESAGLHVVNRASAKEGWLELLASGLTFDLSGFAPGPALRAMPCDQAFGLVAHDQAGDCLTLEPGPHIRSGSAMLPVIRVMARLAARLTELLPVSAVGWPPAATCMEPGYFRRVVDNWLNGGAFPALGLTAILRDENGTARSRGLELLVGQELHVDPAAGESFADTAKLTARMIGEILEIGGLDDSTEFTAPHGERLLAEVSGDRRTVHLRRNQ